MSNRVPPRAPRAKDAAAVEPWSQYFAPVEYRHRPDPPDPDDAAPVDDEDPEEGHPT